MLFSGKANLSADKEGEIDYDVKLSKQYFDRSRDKRVQIIDYYLQRMPVSTDKAVAGEFRVTCILHAQKVNILFTSKIYMVHRNTCEYNSSIREKEIINARVALKSTRKEEIN